MKQTLILTAILCVFCSLYGCSSEPANTGECLEKYMSEVRNDKAAQEIERSCREFFDTNKTDDVYHECILKDMAGAKTDEDVNIIIRRCTIKDK